MITLAFALALVLQGPTSKPIQQAPNAEPTTERSQQEQRPAYNVPPSLNQQNPSPETEQRSKQNPTDEPRHWYQNPTVISSIVQAASAVIMLAFTFLLVWYNRGLLLATKLAAEAATESAKAAGIGNSYLINRERARLRFESQSLPTLMHALRTFSILPQFRNYGASEALITQSGCCFSWTETDIWLFPNMSLCQPLLPQGTVPIDGLTGRTQIDFDLGNHVRQGNLGFLHFFGFVEYRDVFGLSRHTVFYHRVRLIAMKQDSHGQPIEGFRLNWVKGPEKHNQET